MRRPPPPSTSYSLGEEIAHSVTHGIGIVLSIAGLAVLVGAARLHGDARDVVGSAVFGTTLVLLYTASTLYHSIPLPNVRPVLRILDHSGIYLLIAGTYTPIALAKLPSPEGPALLTGLWAAAVVGIVLTATLRHRFRPVAHVLYLLMGWSALLVAGPLRAAIAPAGWNLILAGGLAYTFGVGFYALRRVRYHHLLWHLCVLAGSLLHFFAVLLYVIPSPAG
jgi:hemolysin III